MPIPSSVKNAAITWAEADSDGLGVAEQGFVEALKAWIDSPQDGVDEDLYSLSHGMLAELQRLGQRSMSALVMNFLGDESRVQGLRRFAERESRGLGARNEVTNAVQGILVKILNGHRKKGIDLSTHAKFDAYLRTSCKNDLISQRRKHGRLVSLPPEAEIATGAHSPSAQQVVGEEEAEQRLLSTQREVRERIQTLPPMQRAIMTLSFDHHWGSSALADAFPVETGVDPDSAPSRKTRTQQISRMVEELHLRIVKDVSDVCR